MCRKTLYISSFEDMSFVNLRKRERGGVEMGGRNISVRGKHLSIALRKHPGRDRTTTQVCAPAEDSTSNFLVYRTMAPTN